MVTLCREHIQYIAKYHKKEVASISARYFSELNELEKNDPSNEDIKNCKHSLLMLRAGPVAIWEPPQIDDLDSDE